MGVRSFIFCEACSGSYYRSNWRDNMNMNAAAMAMSTGADLHNMQRVPESMASFFPIANESTAANRIVESGRIQQEDTDTTSGLSHAIATTGVVINIGE